MSKNKLRTLATVEAQRILATPNNSEHYLNCAKLLLMWQRLPAAAVMLWRATRLNPIDLRLNWLRAQYFQMRSMGRASRLEMIKQLIITPSHFGAMKQLLTYRGGADFYADVSQFAPWAKILQPDSAWVLSRYGRQMLRQDKPEVAGDLAGKAMLVNPSEYEAILTLAEVSVANEDLSFCQKTTAWLQVLTAAMASTFDAKIARSKRPALFIHVPKTAGTSILRATAEFSSPIGHRWIETEPTPLDNHYAAWVWPNLTVSKAQLEQRLVFSAVRHILPFLVSFYEHARRGFASHHMLPLVVQARQQSFAEFLQQIAAAHTPWVSRQFLFPAYFDRFTGEMVVDHLVRTETISQDLADLCAANGFTYRPVQRSNKFIDEWRDHYDAALIDLVWRTWKREIALFGFMPDGRYADDVMLYGDVSAHKKRFNYDWRKDRLTLDGIAFTGASGAPSA